MIYDYPRISHIADLEPALEGCEAFSRFERHGLIFIQYNVQIPGMFDGEFGPLRRECRGIAFDAATGLLKSRPLPKFHNINENAAWSLDAIDFSGDWSLWQKLDGSMVRPLLIDDCIRFGTKRGISDAGDQATDWLHSNRSRSMSKLREMWEAGLTPVLEWTSPDNQIVVAYERPELRVLCVRENETGRLRDDLMGDLGLDVVQRHDVPHGPGNDPAKVVEALRARTHEEGAILRVGQNFGKIKCEWYGNLHHLLSNTGFQRRHLARVVLDDQLDDLLPFLGPVRRAEAEAFVQAMWDGVGRIAGEVTDLVSQARAAHGEDRKAIATQFAPGIKCPRAKMFFFMVLRGDELREKIMEYLSEETIRDHRWASVEEWLGITLAPAQEPEMMP